MNRWLSPLHCFGFFPLFVCLLLVSAMASAQTSVWKVSKGNRVVYLGGTVHMLKASDYPLPTAFDIAYLASQSLYFETDIGAMSRPDVQAQLMADAMAPPGRQLQQVLSPDTYATLSEAAGERGLDMATLGRFRAGMAVVTLQTMEFMRMGLTLQGVDNYFYAKSIQDNKPRGYFETVQEQVNFVMRMGEGWEDDFVSLSLRDLDRTEQLMEDMTAAWRRGDMDALASLFLSEMQTDYPRAYDNLMVKRNTAWLPQIEQLFNSKETEFVLVGTAHMVGDDGLLIALQKRGYRVEQMR